MFGVVPARRVATLTSKVRKASILGRTGVALAHNYGMCPRIAKVQHTNTAIASGLGLHTGASATIAIGFMAVKLTSVS